MLQEASFTSRSPRVRTAFETALVAGGLLVLFLLLPHALAGDDFTRFQDVDRLIRHGELSNSRFSLVGPLLSAPFLLLGDVVRWPEWWVARFNVIVVAGGLLATYGLLRRRVDPSLLRKLFLVLLFASLLTNRLRDYNAEVLTAVLVGVGLAALAGGRPVLGWTAIVLGATNTPAALAGLALVAGAVCVQRRRLRYAVPILAGVALTLAEAWIRRGSPFTTGYEGNRGFMTLLPYSGRPEFSYPLLLGVLSIFFSFGRGLLFFAPGLLFSLSSRTVRLLEEYRRTFVLMLLFLLGLVLVYAKWWAWYGGLSWGPRFFVFAAVPASLLLALRLHKVERSLLANSLTLFVLLLSGWVGLNGAVFDLSDLGICSRDDFALESFCWYVPEFSALWHPYVHFPALTRATAGLAAYSALVFFYLVTPLVRAIASDLVQYWRDARTSGVFVGGWRF